MLLLAAKDFSGLDSQLATYCDPFLSALNLLISLFLLSLFSMTLYIHGWFLGGLCSWPCPPDILQVALPNAAMIMLTWAMWSLYLSVFGRIFWPVFFLPPIGYPMD